MKYKEASVPRKWISFILTLLLTFFISLLFLQPASAATLPINQCNGVENVGGRTVECKVTVVNNLNVNTQSASSTTTVENCVGFANAPATCTNNTFQSNDIVLEVTQCDGSGNGGGATVYCSIDITNNVTGTGTVSPVTANQCVGSGGGGGTEPTFVCDPYPATTSGATVTQCNGSGNEGGGDNRVLCTVNTTGTETSLIPVKVSQCNGSGNNGGAYVVCSSSILSNIIAATATSVPTNLTPTVTGRSLTLTFTAPTNDGGSPVIDYSVVLSGSDGSSRTVTATGTTATITDLTPGVTYTVAVTARNSVGTSPAATTVVTVPAETTVVLAPPSTGIGKGTPPVDTLPETGVDPALLLAGSSLMLLIGIALVAGKRKLQPEVN